MIPNVIRYGMRIWSAWSFTHIANPDVSGTGGAAIIRIKLPAMMKGIAEITPSRIARICRCSDIIDIGAATLLSKKLKNFSMAITRDVL
jgi:hypothetical protein